MCLINTSTLKLHEFWGNSIPPYAILSHTWEVGEITLQELEQPSETTPTKQGYLKTKRCAEIVKENGHQWVWVDTCCIDKTSSAELSEAINSMYKWYQNSTVCYVYLGDYDRDNTIDGSIVKSLQQCRWFTRGWTLQELIAPSQVMFYGKNWICFGTRENMFRVLSAVTNIHVAVLKGDNPVGKYSLAQRMSWASQRQTTRKEDTAYCLLGIFDVQMPLLYGEGDKAFLRFQEVVTSRSSDLTLLCWHYRSSTETTTEPRYSLLAPSPTAFENCKHIVSYPASYETTTEPPRCIVAHDGVLAHFPMYGNSSLRIMVPLRCYDETANQSNNKGEPEITLELWRDSTYPRYFVADVYAHTEPWTVDVKSNSYNTIRVCQGRYDSSCFSQYCKSLQLKVSSNPPRKIQVAGCMAEMSLHSSPYSTLMVPKNWPHQKSWRLTNNDALDKEGFRFGYIDLTLSDQKGRDYRIRVGRIYSVKEPQGTWEIRIMQGQLVDGRDWNRDYLEEASDDPDEVFHRLDRLSTIQMEEASYVAIDNVSFRRKSWQSNQNNVTIEFLVSADIIEIRYIEKQPTGLKARMKRMFEK